MSKLVIEGGKKLSGQIATAGDKNSILPILAALILTNGVIVLENVPLIADVFNLIKILEKLGARAEWLRKNTLKVDTTKIHYEKLFTEEIKKLRGSILLLGGLLTRFKKAELDLPGGDIIGARPIDTHIQALEDLGAEIGRIEF
ncbi:UDP-N-acetylglucosamine 1-carboxyvinyltransferase, partial [Patescibacteria group bacterium]|nr:UDP-N-acetylglucosamine 1-carboxyvinyltransferase [Patescibacteria group bacterium]